MIRKLIGDDRGASAISYALIAGIVGVFYSVRATLCAVPAQACSP